MQSDRNSIHKNLCLCLLIGEVVFLAGIGQTHLRVVCGVVAGLLHYFFLAAFAWMFFEGQWSVFRNVTATGATLWGRRMSPYSITS